MVTVRVSPVTSDKEQKLGGGNVSELNLIMRHHQSSGNVLTMRHQHTIFFSIECLEQLVRIVLKQCPNLPHIIVGAGN